MKKVLISVIALTALVGCASDYNYYQGDIKYTQDGDDCIYNIGESGNKFSKDVRKMDANKTIVYRNTMCSDLYARDMLAEQKPVVEPEPVVVPESAPCAMAIEQSALPKCGCQKSGEKRVL